MDNNIREILRLLLHSLLQAAVLAIWIITAWATDQYLLSHFPLEGFSMIGFRTVEVALHGATMRSLYRILFPREEPRGRWWQ